MCLWRPSHRVPPLSSLVETPSVSSTPLKGRYDPERHELVQITMLIHVRAIAVERRKDFLAAVLHESDYGLL